MGSPTPKGKKLYVGIEIECIIPRDVFYSLNNKITNEKYLKKWVDIGGDCSIGNYRGSSQMGIEIRFLSPKNLLKKKLELLCNILKEHKAEVNKTCGLHVHLDCRKGFEVAKKTHNNLVAALPFLYCLVSKQRAKNRYCKPNERMILVEQEIPGDRYLAINASAYHKYKTVEVRLHSATTSFNKIYNWCRILDIISRMEEVPKFEKIESFVKSIGFDKDLKQYILERNARHHSQKSKEKQRAA